MRSFLRSFLCLCLLSVAAAVSISGDEEVDPAVCDLVYPQVAMMRSCWSDTCGKHIVASDCSPNGCCLRDQCALDSECEEQDRLIWIGLGAGLGGLAFLGCLSCCFCAKYKKGFWDPKWIAKQEAMRAEQEKIVVDGVVPPVASAAPVMHVTVPKGCGPGSVVRVDSPAGPMAVTIPKNVSEGQVFAVQIAVAAPPPKSV